MASKAASAEPGHAPGSTRFFSSPSGPRITPGSRIPPRRISPWPILIRSRGFRHADAGMGTSGKPPTARPHRRTFWPIHFDVPDRISETIVSSFSSGRKHDFMPAVDFHAGDGLDDVSTRLKRREGGFGSVKNGFVLIVSCSPATKPRSSVPASAIGRLVRSNTTTAAGS